MQKVCGPSDLGIGWGYAKEAGIVSVTAGLIGAAWDRLKDQRR
jgi:hypothetical protein